MVLLTTLMLVCGVVVLSCCFEEDVAVEAELTRSSTLHMTLTTTLMPTL